VYVENHTKRINNTLRAQSATFLNVESGGLQLQVNTDWLRFLENVRKFGFPASHCYLLQSKDACKFDIRLTVYH
jgi:hypothetical protein